MHNKWMSDTWIIKFKLFVLVKNKSYGKDSRGCVETVEMSYDFMMDNALYCSWNRPIH